MHTVTGPGQEEAMTPLELNNQLGVALLAVIAALVVRRIDLPERVHSLVPAAICLSIFWVFVDLPTPSSTLIHGLVSGLLASGLLFIIRGWTGK